MAATGTAFPRQPAFKLAPPEDVSLQRLVLYSKSHLRWTYPSAHPSYLKWGQETLVSSTERLVSGKMTSEQVEDELRKGGDQVMKTWLGTETNQDANVYRERIPDKYPGSISPKWKQRSRKEAGY